MFVFAKYGLFFSTRFSSSSLRLADDFFSFTVFRTPSMTSLVSPPAEPAAAALRRFTISFFAHSLLNRSSSSIWRSSNFFFSFMSFSNCCLWLKFSIACLLRSRLFRISCLFSSSYVRSFSSVFSTSMP